MLCYCSLLEWNGDPHFQRSFNMFYHPSRVEKAPDYVVTRFFNSAEEACDSIIPHRMHLELADEHTVYIGLTSAVEIDSIKDIIALLDNCELVIFLQGNPTFSESDRQYIYQKMLSFADNRTGNLHLFLLNSPPNNANSIKLSSLKIEHSSEQEPFSPLCENKGYYLSSLDLFSRIFKNKQTKYGAGKDIQHVPQPVSHLDSVSAIQEHSQENTAAYYTAQADITTIRALKKADKQQLRERLRYRVLTQTSVEQRQNQEQVVNEEQRVNQGTKHAQTQSLTQTQAINQDVVNINEERSWRLVRFIFLLEFEQRLLKKAKRVLAQEQSSLDHLQSQGYMLRHPNRLFEKIVNEPSFRQSIASHIYGRAVRDLYSFYGTTPLSIVAIADHIVDFMMDHLSYHMDNYHVLGDKYDMTERLWGIMWLDDINIDENEDASGYCYSNPCDFNSHRATPLLSGLADGFERHLRPYALLDEEDLNQVKPEKKAEMTAIAQRLLRLFTNTPLTDKSIKDDFLALIAFYFPDKKNEYCVLIERLNRIAKEDYPELFKILLHVAIVGKSNLLARVFEMLQMLNQKHLLPLFYQFFVDSQTDILSLTDFYISPKLRQFNNEQCLKSTFIELATLTPLGKPSTWPVFFRFYHYYLLFLSTHHIDTKETVQDFVDHWNKTKEKFLQYTQHDEEKTQQLLELLTARLINARKGFNLKALDYCANILAKLDWIIDAAIDNNTLEEQLENLSSISLIGTDASYAIKCNGFKVVSAEMQLELEKLNPQKNTFAVCLDELNEALYHASGPDENHLSKATIFRYLGTETARESLSYYRQLFNKAEDNHIWELLVAWMIARSTGQYYDPSQALDDQLIELYHLFEVMQLDYQDIAAAFTFFSQNLPNCYDFRSIAHLLKLIKHDLHPFVAHQCLPLVAQIKVWHEQYDSKFIQLLSNFAAHPDGPGKFNALIAAPQTINDELAKLTQGDESVMERSKNSLNKTTLRGLLLQHEEGREMFSEVLKNPPKLFLKPLMIDNLSHFIEIHKTELREAIQALEASRYQFSITRIAYALFESNRIERDEWRENAKKILNEVLLKAKIAASCTRQKTPIQLQIDLLELIKIVYPALTIDSMLESMTTIDVILAELLKLEAIVGEYCQQDKLAHALAIYRCMGKLLHLLAQPTAALVVLEAISKDMRQISTEEGIYQYESFLNTLCLHKQLLTYDLKQLAPALNILWSAILSNDNLPSKIAILFCITEKLFAGYSDKPPQTIKALSIFLKAIASWQDVDLITACNGLNPNQLTFYVDNILSLNDTGLAIGFIKLMTHHHNKDLVRLFTDTLTALDEEKKVSVLSICCTICLDNIDALPQLAHQLNSLPAITLTRLEKMIAKHTIDFTRLSGLLLEPSVDDALDTLDKESRTTALINLDVPLEQVIQKIEEIKYKPMHENEDVSLHYREKKQILNDYCTVMSLLKGKPVAVKCTATRARQALSIHELSEAAFQDMLHQCRQTLRSDSASLTNKHQASLICLALSCVAMQHTVGKTPTYLQLISIINSINHSGNIIHEIPTSGGKSILSALHATWLWALGKTVTVATCNNALAARDAAFFKPFYDYLGVESSASIITPDSPVDAYQKDAIHYSTGPNLALFLKKARLQGTTLADNPALIADEVDAALKTRVDSRVATSIDPIFADKKKWKLIYPMMMEFVNEAEIFINNPCSQADDVRNLRLYLLEKSASIPSQKQQKSFYQFIQQLPDSLLNQYIDSAVIANELEENVHYQVVMVEKDKSKALKHPVQKKYFCAAPILDTTKRPDSRVSWAEGVQPLLHAKLNMKNPSQHIKFAIDVEIEEIAVVSAKNFFDYFYLNQGIIIGLTATAGGLSETEEFYQQNKFVSFSEPSFHADRCIVLPLETASNQSALYELLFQKMINNAQQFPGQPVLIFMESAKIAGEFRDFLATKSAEDTQAITATIQYYDGSEKAGEAEAHFIQTIGVFGQHTITTESLARGADPTTDHPDGLFVINTCVNITGADVQQIKGRTARNGKPGKFICILNEQQLSPGAGDTAAEKYASLQKMIEKSKMNERLKIACLNDIRHFVIENCFLALKNKADALYQRQHGLGHSLIDTKGFYTALHAFNKNIEHYYQTLLDNGVGNNPETLRDSLITFAIDEYNTYLNHAIADEDLTAFNAEEPLLLLDQLNNIPSNAHNITIKNLTLMSQFLAGVWMRIGNHRANNAIHFIGNLLEPFVPDFCKSGSALKLIHLIAVFLYRHGFFEFNTIKNQLATVQEELRHVPLIGAVIPHDKIEHFVRDYIHETTAAIQQKNWDAIAWPNINFKKIYAWIMSTMGYSSTLGGYSVLIGNALLTNPQGVLSKYIYIPIIKKLLLTLINDMKPQDRDLFKSWVDNMDTLIPSVLEVIHSFYDEEHWNEITLNTIVEKLKPILNSPLIVGLIEKYIDRPEFAYIKPVYTALPGLWKILSSFADLKISALFTVNHVMKIMAKISQLEEVQQAVSIYQLEDKLKNLRFLNAEFFEQCQTIGAIPFTQLMTVIAHPLFSEFLASLPQETTFETMKKWLASAGLITLEDPQSSDALSPPSDIEAALQKLIAFQTDTRKLEAQARLEMATLKQAFVLTRGKIDAHLNYLAKRPIPRLILTHTDLKKEEAVCSVIAPLTLVHEGNAVSLEEDKPSPIPSVNEWITQPDLIRNHLETLMLRATVASQSERCTTYAEWLCQQLLNPNIDFASKKRLPEKIFPIVSKLSPYCSQQSTGASSQLFKNTAIHLLKEYQKSWFLSFDRRALVRQLLVEITQSTDSLLIHERLIKAKQVIYQDDAEADQSFFRRIFKLFRNKKGYSRLHDTLDLLTTTSATILLTQGKVEQYETSASNAFTATMGALLEQLNNNVHPNESYITLNKLNQSIHEATKTQDKQYFMNSACDVLSKIQVNEPKPSAKLLADSLQRANILQRESTGLDYIPAVSLLSAG